ncbi:MAG: restriction endonuclease subunit S, partial [Deltaproteobacteria bacterium]|nr:restriction endonuclease subunit S [Deltaproteobacteria bacterium]
MKIYKDSGFEWIGEIPEHWSVTKLKNQCQIIPSNVDKKSHDDEIEAVLCNYVDVYRNDFINCSLEFMIATANEHELKKFQLIKEDVLITKDSEDPYDIAVPALVVETQPKLLCGYHLSIIRSNNQRLRGSYLFWVLRDTSIASQLHRQATGITRWAIATRHVKNSSIPLPPLSEQQTIAAYLDKTCAAIDKAIEVKQKQLEILDALRKSIIHKAVTRGLDDLVELKDSWVEWMPKKPKNWKTCRIKDALDFFNTQRVPLSADVRGVMIEKKYDYYGASGIIDKVDDYLFDGTYILIAEDGANLLMRNSPLAFLATGKFWVNNHAHILKPQFGNDQYFVYLLESL